MGEPSSDSTTDPSLEAAVDSFVGWALDGPAGETRMDPTGLPPLRDLEEIDPGTMLDDYELVRRLGSGGMGVVYEARQRSVGGRRVAVKLLRNLVESERLARRFRREIAAVANLDHPAIVPIVGANVTDGTPFYAMKYVAGLPASRLLRELRESASSRPDVETARAAVLGRSDASSHDSRSASTSGSGRRSGDGWRADYTHWVAEVGRVLAEALQHVHENGMIHRDVKPGNVMITPSGRPVLLDFGLASTVEDPSLTAQGDFVGTLAYAPPEQVRGEPTDTRADVYSLGATLYELLSLRRPFDCGSRTALLSRIEKEEPYALEPYVPLDLRTIVSCAMEKSPERRYATPGAMADDLRAFLTGQPILARPPGPVARLVRLVGRFPRTATAFGVACLFVLGLRAADHVRAGAWRTRGERLFERALEVRSKHEENMTQARSLLDAARRGVGLDHLALDRLKVERRALELEEERTFDEVEAALSHAFEHVAGDRATRHLLADVRAARLRNAFRDSMDLLHPERVHGIAALLADLEDVRYEALLDERARIDLLCASDPATVTVLPDGGAPHAPRSAPVLDLVLPAGSYVALFEAPGRAPARMPFVVRPRAAYEEDAPGPPRVVEVELLGADEVPDDYAYVPAGWTLVRDDPPHWKHVDAFLVHRHEVTYAALLDWWRALSSRHESTGLDLLPGSTLYRPRFSEDEPHLLPTADGGLRPREGFELDQPVRGLTPMEIGHYAQVADFLSDGLPPGWHVALPSVDEWMRAFRGADARPYPWGRTFDWSIAGGYFSQDDPGNGGPHPAGRGGSNASPFGVLDLAGSLTEMTADLQGPNPGRWVGCGGSYRSASSEDLRADARHELGNELRQDLGFRFVARPAEAWTDPPEDRPAELRDDFERPDGDDVGDGWIELVGTPLGLRTDPHAEETCRIEEGRLVLEGGVGDFSEPVSALHPIGASPGGTRIRARLSIAARSGEAPTRWFSIDLRHGFHPGEKDLASLFVGLAGQTNLQVTRHGRVLESAAGSMGDPVRRFEAELTLLPERAVAVVRDLESQAESYLQVELPPDLRPPRFVVFTAPNLIGGRASIDEVELRPVPDR